MSETTIDQLAEALENVEWRTPMEVLDAFCPVGRKIGGVALVELTAGHDLFLSRIRHPLAIGKGSSWQAHDVATALFAFTRPSVELEKHISQGTLEDALHEFLGTLPMAAMETAAADLLAHWIRARSTAVAMQAPAGIRAPAAKKKPDSDGCFPSSPPLAGNSLYRRMLSFTTSLFRRS